MIRKTTDTTIDRRPTAEFTRDDRMLLVRHTAGKALVAADRIDIETVPYGTIGAPWRVADDVQHGSQLIDPTGFEEWGADR